MYLLDTPPGWHEQVASTLAAIDIATVEPADWFCPDRTCPVVVGSILGYRDASHMSAPYSEYLAPALAPVFIAKDTGA